MDRPPLAERTMIPYPHDVCRTCYSFFLDVATTPNAARLRLHLEDEPARAPTARPRGWRHQDDRPEPECRLGAAIHRGWRHQDDRPEPECRLGAAIHREIRLLSCR